MVMRLTADLQEGGSWAADLRQRWPTRVRNADLHHCGQFALPLDHFFFCSTCTPHCLKLSVPLKKKPKLCVSAYLPACPTDWLTN